MSKYLYTGLDAFGEDAGTYSPPRSGTAQSTHLPGIGWKAAANLLKKSTKNLPVIWFVDDERGNREWFRDYHRDHFGVVTFSSRSHFLVALGSKLKCDAIVTDIFFPSKPVTDERMAKSLLAIYPRMGKKPTSELPKLWANEKKSGRWSLDGFSVAHDAAYHKPPIPVFLFSRKATLLLSVDEFIGQFPVAANSYWLLEKVNPMLSPSIARRAAEMQRQRILAVLALRDPSWKKLAVSLVKGASAGASVVRAIYGLSTIHR